jgi:hypothetical protein
MIVRKRAAVFSSIGREAKAQGAKAIVKQNVRIRSDELYYK